jgi:hypothetical protein
MIDIATFVLPPLLLPETEDESGLAPNQASAGYRQPKQATRLSKTLSLVNKLFRRR